MTTRSREPWSPEEDHELGMLMANRKPAPMIADHLKRTTRSVRRRAEVLKLSWKGNSASGETGVFKLTNVSSTRVNLPHVASPQWSSDEDDRLKQLAKEGQSAREIAERLKRTRPAVYTRAKKLGARFNAAGDHDWPAPFGGPG